ncbi:MAG: Chromosome partition protein Smc [Deltaproteobacteria bacterium ADurb.Bin510]|nr:MAG: Chromosome partition protein Smc [Deltaproteobacteria bacterium ADurb.Bin510]
MTASLEACDSVLRQLLARRGALKARLDESERAIQAERAQLELALSRITAGQARLDDITTSRQRLSERIAELEAGQREGLNQVAAAATGAAQLEQELGRCAAALELSESSLNQLTAETAKLDQSFELARSAVYEALGEQRALEQRQSALNRRRQETAANLSRRQAELNELDQNETLLKQEQAAATNEAAALEDGLAGLRASLAALEERAAELRQASEAARQRLLAGEKAEAETRAKLSVLGRLLEGQQSPQTAGPRLRSLIKPKPGFEETVGRALGNALDYALVETHADIAGHAGCIQAGDGGRAAADFHGCRVLHRKSHLRRVPGDVDGRFGGRGSLRFHHQPEF